MELPDNNRSRTRLHPIYEVQVLDAVQGDDLGLVIDASEGGMRLACPRRMEPGHDVTLEVQVDTPEGVQRFRCDACVRWCKSSEKHSLLNVVGIEFVRFEEEGAGKRLIALLRDNAVAPFGA